MEPVATPRLTPAEYLATERAAQARSEYQDGMVRALAGARWQHNVIVGNLGAAINSRALPRSGRAVTSDMKVWIPETRRFLYPDVVVVCGEPAFFDETGDALLNPALIVEVLSPSTEAYDRGAKFGHYRTIASLREYVLVAQDSAAAESFVRQDSARFWRYSATLGLASSLALSSCSVEIPLAEIYAGATFGG